MRIPDQIELMSPTLEALRQLGGSGSIHEINEVVIKRLGLPDEVAQELQGQGPQTRLEHRLGWARTRLKHAGLVDNSRRGVWNLTPTGFQLDPDDPEAVSSHYGDYQRHKQSMNLKVPQSRKKERDEGLSNGPEDGFWREELLAIIREVSPDAFERLCQRLLRESGFIEVEVTGRSGDGGIDVQGTIQLNGLVSFPVMVQCKRFKGNVGPSLVRDFRGAMTGRADRGLLITTGNFTRDAVRESTRPGTPPIDLIDGNRLVEKLKELELGVQTHMVEQVILDEEWFQSI
ncbi:MAG: restriction endonuclease [Chloroflexi bacterium]|nr:restriction endonuclease [Chloroflexota bacterium]